MTNGPLVSRRRILAGMGAAAAASAFPSFWRQAAIAGAPGPSQVHLQYGADASREMTVSWTTPAAVSNPRVQFGPSAKDLDGLVKAETLSFTDALSGTTVYCHHARITGLDPSRSYRYLAIQDGSTATGSTFRTAPSGRAAFRFTSFGDQCTGTTGDALAAPQGSWVTAQIEAADPLFHTVNGDLSYANTMATGSNPVYDRSAVWDHWFTNNAPSAMNRPWMPALGNHENEKGNGALGLAAYQSRFALPGNGSSSFSGNWYAFTVGAVRFITVDTNDVVYSTDFDFPIYGYSAGAQKKWLESELRAARYSHDIDWVVVFVHYPVMSTAGGSDLGLREQYQPLFDEYMVDLVLTGHSHDYERMYPVRGVVSGSATLEPNVVSYAADHYNTAFGGVHMVLGTGGVSLATPTYGGTPADPTASVTVAGGGTQSEPAPYSAKRGYQVPYGFLQVDVEPGHHGGLTSMTLSFFATLPPGAPAQPPYDQVTLVRPRSDSTKGAAP